MTDSKRPRHSLDDFDDDVYDDGGAPHAFDEDSRPEAAGSDESGSAHDFEEDSYDNDPDSLRGYDAEESGIDAESTPDAYDNTADHDDYYDEFDEFDEDPEDRRGAGVAGMAGAGAAGAGLGAATGAGAAGVGTAGAKGAGAGAAGATAAGAGAAGKSQGVPIRGLAMVLIAVAVLFMVWGAFSLLGDDDKSGEKVASESGVQKNGDEKGAEQGKKPTSEPKKAPAKAPAKEDKKTEKAPAEEPAKAPEEQPAPPAAAPAEVDRNATHVTVLNNSPIKGLAGKTATTLRDGQWDASSVGNLPDTERVFNKSAVYYPAGDATSQAAAEEIAGELGIGAEQRDGDIDKSIKAANMLEGPDAGEIVVITTNDMQS